MDKHEAIEIIRKGCKTIKQKEAIDLLFKHDTSIKKTDYKCKYYHKLCSRCLNWPTPEDIEKVMPKTVVSSIRWLRFT